jgi:hypothetical protein
MEEEVEIYFIRRCQAVGLIENEVWLRVEKDMGF